MNLKNNKLVVALKENTNGIRVKFAIAGGITVVAIVTAVALTKYVNTTTESDVYLLPEGVTFEDVVEAFDAVPAVAE